MNLFVTHPLPARAAKDLDDSRVRKMLIETAQLLCTALRLEHGIDPCHAPYKPTHKNHPITKWMMTSTGNIMWSLKYGVELHAEYQRRFGKQHKSGIVLDTMYKIIPELLGTIQEMTPFQNSARKKPHYDFTFLYIYDAYRTYLNAKWKHDKRRPKWTNTNPPTWFNNAEWTGPKDKI